MKINFDFHTAFYIVNILSLMQRRFTHFMCREDGQKEYFLFCTFLFAFADKLLESGGFHRQKSKAWRRQHLASIKPAAAFCIEKDFSAICMILPGITNNSYKIVQ